MITIIKFAIAISFIMLFGVFCNFELENQLVKNVFAENNFGEQINESTCIPYFKNYTAFDFETMTQKFRDNKPILIQAYMNNCKTNEPFTFLTKIFLNGNLYKESWITGIQSEDPPDPKYAWNQLVDAGFIPKTRGIYEIEISIIDNISNRVNLSPPKKFSVNVGDGTQIGFIESKRIDEITSEKKLEDIVSNSSQRNIPKWISNTALWYGEGHTTAFEFVNALQYLINQKIIIIPTDSFNEDVSDYEQKIPDWVKNTALWYGKGTISEDDFVNAIQYLIDKRIIIV